MPVDTKHPQYLEMEPIWKKNRTFLKGEEAVKAAGSEILPMLDGQYEVKAELPAPKKKNVHNLDYERYKDRARVFEAPKRAREGLSGLLSCGEGTVKVPKASEPMLKHIGKDGRSFMQLKKEAIDEVVGVGRIGVLVDAPKPRPDTPNARPRPYMVFYEAEEPINWKEEMVLGRRTATLWVLQEEKAESKGADFFEMKSRPRWRVLRYGTLDEFEMIARTALLTSGRVESTAIDKIPLDAVLREWQLTTTDFMRRQGEDVHERVYWQELWIKDEKAVQSTDAMGNASKDTWILEELIVPRMSGGRLHNEIPFDIINPEDQEPKPKMPPINPITNLAASEYRNSADLEHGAHYTALPTPVAVGFKLKAGQYLYIGSKAAWVAEDPNAKAFMLEFSGAGLGMLMSLMEQKRKEMAALGARMLEQQPKMAETAEAVRLRQSGEAVTLEGIAQSISEGLTRALYRVLNWEAPTDEAAVEVKIDVDFSTYGIEPAKLTALMAMVMGGTMSWKTLYWNLKNVNMYPEGWTEDDEAAAIAAGRPLGDQLGGGVGTRGRPGEPGSAGGGVSDNPGGNSPQNAPGGQQQGTGTPGA